METQSIAKNLVYQRKLKGFSQEELSEKTQVTVRTIQRIEKGDVNPHLQTIKLLATALEIELDDLMILENPKQENIQTKWLLLLHGTPILGLILPLCNILFPLFLWIHKREDNVLYDTHGRKVINFQISITLLYLLSFVALVTIEGWGFLFFIAVIPFSIIVTFINIFKAINTQKCYYPLSIPFIKTNAIAKMIVVLVGSVTMLTPSKTDAQTIKRLDGSSISTDSLTNKINQLVNDAKIQGIAVTVFNNNKVVYEKSFGYKDYEKKLPFNETTNIYGASFSKAVFGVLVMKLVEQGIIDLDTPLESYLPKKIHEYKPLTRWHDDYSALKKDSLYPQITARMCLSHTTGFPNYRWFESDQQLRVLTKPGTRFSYSGEGLIYLQVILEKITGKNLEELAQEFVFKPLQMNRSSYKWQQKFALDFAYGHNTIGEKYEKDIDNEPRGAGTLETTALDFGQFLKAVLDHKILSKKSWNELFKNQINIKSKRQVGALSLEDGTQNDGIQLGYGLGWGILQTPYGFGTFKEGHGDGFQHYFILFPKAKTGIMIMTNSDNGEGVFKELLEVAIKDIYTPYEWQNYFPYNRK
ncbi:serine hydrolase [Flavobacterium sp.]|uniref:serine hydrolase n=1 Tax=Flavobacterium sp. TaxID=239 RepID=UPI00286A597F|nr:serine hydrolase [Flavobacterium sp.]